MILSTVRFILVTRSGCSKKHNHRKETLNEKSISLVGILACILLGHVCFLVLINVCFISRSLSRLLLQSVLCGHRQTGQQVWSLEWLMQLSDRFARSSRSQDRQRTCLWFWFSFLVLKRRFLLQKKKYSSELCRNTGFYTILKKNL